jgi:nitroreductase
MDAYLAVVSRREVRDYIARPLPPEVERAILEAGRLAGSAKNRQPWEFVVVREDATVEVVADCVYEPANVRRAAFVVAIVTFRKPGIDIGRAAQNMLLAAHALGVGSCPNGIADGVGVTRALGVGAEEQVALVLTFGYPARTRDPRRRSAAEWVERANRRPYDEVVREV